MKIRNRFVNLVRRLNYPHVRFISAPSGHSLSAWSKIHMPLVVHELADLGWNLESEDTWLENTFITECMYWYGKRVGVFITDRYSDWLKAEKFLNSSVSTQFREYFGLDYHLSLLLHDHLFINADELGDIYTSMDFSKGWGLLDLSHVDDEENVTTDLQEDWGWLDAEQDDDDWSAAQVSKIYNQVMFKQEAYL